MASPGLRVLRHQIIGILDTVLRREHVMATLCTQTLEQSLPPPSPPSPLPWSPTCPPGIRGHHGTGAWPMCQQVPVDRPLSLANAPCPGRSSVACRTLLPPKGPMTEKAKDWAGSLSSQLSQGTASGSPGRLVSRGSRFPLGRKTRCCAWSCVCTSGWARTLPGGISPGRRVS